MKKLLFFISCIGFLSSAHCQVKPLIITKAIIVDGDTIPLIELNEVFVYSKYSLLSNDEIRKNKKLIRNVKKTLPYAKLAFKKLLEINDILEATPKEKRKELIKQIEKDIEKEFSTELKNLTNSQGFVLIKLIDRETGNSSYQLVKELRGNFRAFFYQTFARIFGFNLKTKFDPSKNKEDELIDRICRSIELNINMDIE